MLRAPEKPDALGGQFISAAYPPGKGEYITYVCYMVNELKKLGVTVELNKNADMQSVLGFGADKVIIATGGVPKRPDIPGIGGENVYWPEDILRGRKQVEGEIAVIGGGESGAETAMYLAVAVSVSANLAFTIPPAFVPVGTCYAYPYGGGKYTLRWGIVASLVSIVITALLIYPLGMLFA